MRKPKRLMTGEDFDALPDAEKERIWQEIDLMSPEELLAKSRPLNKNERVQWGRARRKVTSSNPARKCRSG